MEMVGVRQLFLNKLVGDADYADETTDEKSAFYPCSPRLSIIRYKGIHSNISKKVFLFLEKKYAKVCIAYCRFVHLHRNLLQNGNLFNCLIL